jgi:hypothetical protein
MACIRFVVLVVVVALRAAKPRAIAGIRGPSSLVWDLCLDQESYGVSYG